jgi:hypothetical protein
MANIRTFALHRIGNSTAFIEVTVLNPDLYRLRRDDTMNTFLLTLGLAVVFIGIGFAGIAVKILLKKNGEFSGTCASQSPFLNKEGEACSMCGALPSEKCKSDDQPKRDEKEFSPFVA